MFRFSVRYLQSNWCNHFISTTVCNCFVYNHARCFHFISCILLMITDATSILPFIDILILVQFDIEYSYICIIHWSYRHTDAVETQYTFGFDPIQYLHVVGFFSVAKIQKLSRFDSCNDKKCRPWSYWDIYI